MKTIRVALYGNNLVLATIGAILQHKPELQVQQIEGRLPGTLKRGGPLPLDVVLFDLATAQPDFILPLLRKQPTILLIGVDLAGQEMLVFSGKPSRLLTAEDLVRVIAGGAAK